MARAVRKRKREALRDLMLDKATDMLHRMDEPHKDFRGKDADEVWWDKAPADSCRAYATSAAILVDKFRLEVGESTSRPELTGPDQIAGFMLGARTAFEIAEEKAEAGKQPA